MGSFEGRRTLKGGGDIHLILCDANLVSAGETLGGSFIYRKNFDLQWNNLVRQ